MAGRPRQDCEFEPYVDGFRRRLESLGYTPGAVANQLAVVGRFGRWLAVHGRPVDRLDPADIDAFIADQHRDGRRHGVFRQGLVLLRAYLVDVRAVPADHPSARDVVGELVDSYCEWLLRERGLAATTVRRYQATARRFLSQRAWRRSERPDRGRGQRVPAGTGWHDSGVPPRLSTDTIRSLLDSCDPVDPGRDPELLAIAADRLEPVIGAAVSR